MVLNHTLLVGYCTRINGKEQVVVLHVVYVVGPLWTDPGLNSGISVHELISASKQQQQQQQQQQKHEKRRPGMTGRTVSQNPRKRE